VEMAERVQRSRSGAGQVLAMAGLEAVTALYAEKGK
jgi:hypothetical protein